MAYALDFGAPSFPEALDLDRIRTVAMATHDSVVPLLSRQVLSADGANAGQVIPAAIAGYPGIGLTLEAASAFRLEHQRTVLRLVFPPSTMASAGTRDPYLPSCPACFGCGYRTPLRSTPLLKMSGTTDDGRAVWREYPREERQAAVGCLTGAKLDRLVPRPLRDALDSVAEKLDELRGTGALDAVVAPIGEADKALGGRDELGLTIHARISHGPRLAAVASLYSLTPYGRKIDCGEGPALYASDWAFAKAQGCRPKKADIDYFIPCRWCRGSRVIESPLRHSLARGVLVVRLLALFVGHRFLAPAGSKR